MRKNVVSSFIEKTWDILQDGHFSHILRWTAFGHSFEILDQGLLCFQILPKYFKHSNFSSFIRQVETEFTKLNMYNFHKKKTEGSIMEFYHKLFRKDQKQLLIGIKRKPSQAEILFGDQLIRKHCGQTQSLVSMECNNSFTDCKNTNLPKPNQTFKPQQMSELSEWLKGQDPMVSYQLMANNVLLSSDRLNYLTVSRQTQTMKIKTNIILKTPNFN